MSLTLGWNASQQNAAFDSGTAKVGHYLNGNWTEENSGRFQIIPSQPQEFLLSHHLP